MIAFTPTGAVTASSGGILEAVKGQFGEGTDYEPLDDFLRVSLTIYRDPEDTQGYYRISIAAGTQAGNLEVMPKEIILMIDASLSIQRKRLAAFKRGIDDILHQLNPGDRFNLFAFKENVTFFAPQSIPAAEDSIQQALQFLDHLRAGQRTDLYQAFLDSLQQEALLLPSYILLFSDGKPNTGITSQERIITEVTQVNGQQRSIFTLSGGERVNRFLLDFMAYQNRGWAQYAKTELEIPQKIRDLYGKIKNPILLNLRYQLNALNEAEIYPKHLPDFYRDTAFVLYGVFDQEKEFSMRLLGEALENTETSSSSESGGHDESPGTRRFKTVEFIFSRDLSQASLGDRDIARHWALNKVYHLISEMTQEGYKAEKLEEIRKLTRKFDLQTPYLF